MNRLFFLNLFSKLSLLSFLAIAVSCGKHDKPEEPTAIAEDSVDDTAEEATKASGEEDSKDELAQDSIDTAQGLCFSEGELIESVGIKTDLFYAGSSFEDNYGNMFKFYDSQYAVVLNDDFAVNEFSVDSSDIKTLVSSGELAEAKVSDVAYVKFMFNTDLTFTSTQKDFFTDLSSEEQSEFIKYEFKQLFDSLAGTFELSLNDKAFYSSDDKSKFSYELSGFHSIETMVDTEVETEAAQESGEETEVVTEDADTDSETDVESQGSGLSGDDDSAVVVEDGGDAATEDVDMASEDTTDAEEMVEDEGTEEELVEEDNTIAFKVTATVTYLVSVEDLMANSTFASLTTCAAEETDEASTDAETTEETEGDTETSESEEGAEETEEVMEESTEEDADSTESTEEVVEGDEGDNSTEAVTESDQESSSN